MTTARPAKTRSEGQWALGDREALNPNEEMKQAGAPLDVRERIENVYAKSGFDSIEKSDLRGRSRWWGLYTQREQGYDGSFTGDENADLLEAKYFMMRVRCDGGALSSAALRTVGQISTEFARDTAATALALMLRSAGIPARIVNGYRGAETPEGQPRGY